MDIALIWDPERATADLAIVNGDLALDAGPETAVILSLFTDAPARADDAAPWGTNDRGGWWADALSDVDGDHCGSRLNLLSRGKLTREVLQQIKAFAEEGLDWMLEDRVAAAVTVGVRRIDGRNDAAGMFVRIDRPTGPAREQFDYVWSAV